MVHALLEDVVPPGYIRVVVNKIVLALKAWSSGIVYA
jgi:hypothetical protein